MKRLLLLLLLLLLLSASSEAAITVTARGSGNNGTSATSVNISPATTIAAGSMGVICIAVNNAGSGGASTICAASMTDSVGNLWTERQNGLYDNGAANAGVEIAVYTATISTQVTSSDTITVSFSTATSAKAWAVWELSVAGGKVAQYVTGAIGTGSTTGTPTITTGSITSGDAVVGLGGSESDDTWTGDSDTTNGSWSTKQSNANGTGTSGMSVISQVKVVSATATQTYNPTLTSCDVILGWISVTEANPPPGGYRRSVHG